MTSTETYRWQEIKRMRKRSVERRAAIGRLIEQIPEFHARVAEKANVTISMVSKVLHGKAVSRKVEAAIEAEMQGAKTRAA